MTLVQQGELLHIPGVKSDVLVLSKNFFNQTGFAVVCPVLKNGGSGELRQIAEGREWE